VVKKEKDRDQSSTKMMIASLREIEIQSCLAETPTMWGQSPRSPRIRRTKRLNNLTQPNKLLSTQKKQKTIQRRPTIPQRSPTKPSPTLSQKNRSLTMSSNITSHTTPSSDSRLLTKVHLNLSQTTRSTTLKPIPSPLMN